MVGIKQRYPAVKMSNPLGYVLLLLLIMLSGCDSRNQETPSTADATRANNCGSVD